MSKAPGRNEPCWCGSGRKYKRCHLLRGREERLTFGAVKDKVERSAAYRTCLHPEASRELCGGVISAHTLPRSRVLQAIATIDNHVMSFHPVRIDAQGRLKAQRRGWRRAATFEAFCDVHDGTVFAPLEGEPFEGTAPQIFLIGYRAVCWELYQKIRAIRGSPAVRDLLDRGLDPAEQREVQFVLQAQADGFEKGRAESLRVKLAMDRALIAEDYSNYSMVEVLLAGSTSVVATGAVTPNRTLAGKQLQVLHDPSHPSEWLAFGVDVGDRGTSIVFLWVRGEESTSLYMNEILELADPELMAFLPQFFFAHCENTYFSEAWWNSLGRADRVFLTELMENGNPYYDPPEYDLDRRLTEWKLLRKREVSTKCA